LFREAEAVVSNGGGKAETRIKSADKNERIRKLEQQISEAREYMKTMSEEFEATREELQSSNEEVLSSNEELQSMNEELETSKEELQSTNEELITINEELQQRNKELKEAGNFARNIVDTINEPLLVLNEEMRIRSANNAFYRLFKTNIDRTEGNYLFELENGKWNLPELKEKLLEIIQKGKSFENCEITNSFPAIGEKTLLFNAMRMDREDKKNYVLLVIQDMTEKARVQRDLSEREERFRLLLQNAFDVTTIYSKDGDILYQSEALEKTLGYPVKETLNKNIFELGIVHPDDLEMNKELMNEALNNPGKNIKGQLRLQHKNGSYKTMDVIFRNLLNNDHIKGLIGNYQDVTNNIEV